MPGTTDGYRHIRVLLPLMIIPGFVLLLPGGTVETIMEYYGFQESLGGLVNVVYFLGGTVAVLYLTHLMKKYSTKQLVVGTCALLSASLFACSAAPWYPMFLVLFFFAGAANGILIVFPGIYVANIFGEKSTHGQNTLYAFFAFGVVISPMISGLIIDGGFSWRWAYVVPAALILPMIPALLFSGLIDLKHVKTLSLKLLRRISGDNRMLFWGLLMGVTLYIGAESSVSLWVIRYFDESFENLIIEPHWVLTFIWIGITLGRFLIGYLSNRIKPYYILFLIVLGSTALLVVSPLLGSQVASLILYPVIGLMFSGIYPTMVSYTVKFSPEYSGTVFALIVAIGAAGGMVLPYVIGLFSQFGGVTLAMTMIGLPMLVVLFLVLRMADLLSDHDIVIYQLENPG